MVDGSRLERIPSWSRSLRSDVVILYRLVTLLPILYPMLLNAAEPVHHPPSALRFEVGLGSPATAVSGIPAAWPRNGRLLVVLGPARNE